MSPADIDDPGTWPGRARAVLEMLPAGAIDEARVSVRMGLECAGAEVDRWHWLDDEWLEARLAAPLILDHRWPPPTQPVPVGDGAVHADLVGSDRDDLARLRSVLADELGDQITAERLAAEAQVWRLAVTPYRRIDAARRALARQPDHPARGACDPIDDRQYESRPRDQPLVVDLSALWAGPLATALLADLGAEVVKIDPEARPDGLRGQPEVYDHLNSAKEIIDLDLRDDMDRRRFEDLLSRADLLVDSFSRRVLPNFGYDRSWLSANHPHLRTLSIVAFPTWMDEADWISYGPGIHAVMGLGDRGKGRAFEPAPIAYPDALAGLAAFAAGAEMLTRATPGAAEVSLAGSVGPLVHRAAAERDPVHGDHD